MIHVFKLRICEFQFVLNSLGFCDVLWSWGANKHGELGFGDKETRSQPFPIQSLKGKQVTKISCGGQFAICLG